MSEHEQPSTTLRQTSAVDAQTQRSLTDRGDQLHCRYCGSPLSSMFYFCTGCGTPYKDIEAMLVPSSPPILTEGERINIKAPAVWPLFWTYFAIILGAGVLSMVLFQVNRPDLSLFLNDAILFVTTCIFAAIYRESLFVQFKRFGFNHPAALIGFGLLIVALLVNFGYSTLIESLASGDAADPLDQLRNGDHPVGEITLIICFCVLPAVTEEIAFRGLLQHWLATAIKPWRAMALASFLFALLHFNVLGLPILFGVGMLLGWVKWKTGSLYPSMLLHFLHNLVVIQLFV